MWPLAEQRSLFPVLVQGYTGLAEGTAVQILTCHQVPDEESLVLFVVLQHALEVFLLSLDRDLSCELMVPPVTLCQCLGS